MTSWSGQSFESVDLSCDWATLSHWLCNCKGIAQVMMCQYHFTEVMVLIISPIKKSNVQILIKFLHKVPELVIKLT